jgi:nucleotide-binding universal stress UspA family protein
MTTQMASARVSLENVLFATDFSKHSNQALPFVLSIARKYGSTISAVHIITSPLGEITPTIEMQAIGAQLLRDAEQSMKDLNVRLHGVSHETIIRKGDICEQLATIVDQKGIDLIVVGTHGRAGVSKILMGSVAERIFRQATCPVLTIGPNVSGEPGSIADIHTILYPTDFSSESLAALPYAVSLAQENQSRLYLFHVTPTPVPDSDSDSLMLRLRALVPPEARLWCEPKVFVDSGDPAEKVLDLSEELAVDLVVLGTKHVSRFAGTRTHLGMATAYKIARQAICPVLSVRG